MPSQAPTPTPRPNLEQQHIDRTVALLHQQQLQTQPANDNATGGNGYPANDNDTSGSDPGQARSVLDNALPPSRPANDNDAVPSSAQEETNRREATERAKASREGLLGSGSSEGTAPPEDARQAAIGEKTGQPQNPQAKEAQSEQQNPPQPQAPRGTAPQTNEAQRTAALAQQRQADTQKEEQTRAAMGGGVATAVGGQSTKKAEALAEDLKRREKDAFVRLGAGTTLIGYYIILYVTWINRDFFNINPRGLGGVGYGYHKVEKKDEDRLLRAARMELNLEIFAASIFLVSIFLIIMGILIAILGLFKMLPDFLTDAIPGLANLF